VRADERDIASIARSTSAIAHCPASNSKLGHGVAPVDEFLAAGVPVGLGSDSMASNNRMDILEEARLALLTQRARLRSSETPSAEDMLEMATIGGARALGIDSIVGTLEEGKEADLAAFAVESLGPVHDPVASAVFSITGSRASFVAVSGKPLVQGGRLLLSRPELADRMQYLADALAEWLASGGEMRGIV
jgi:5-methylthioadenosine/S-adenosylhomocysteine deaminase